MPKKLILAVDVGTSAVKTILFDVDLNQVAISRRFYPLIVPQSGWSEQDPDQILVAVKESIAEILESTNEDRTLTGMVLSCQLYNVFAVDSKGNPITPMLSWSDNRSSEIAQRIRQGSNSQAIYQVTGCPIEGIYPLSKIRWMIENGCPTEGTHFISVKDYIIFHLTGRFITDWSMASSTGMMDIRNHQWDPDILSIIGIHSENLSELASPLHVIQLESSDFQTQTGIPPGTPLVIGAGDAPLSSLGVGGLDPGVLVVNVGTSTAARKIISEPISDPKRSLWTYVFDETHWITGGMSSSGGIVYEWFLKQFKMGTSMDGVEIHKEFEELAALTAPGADGLFFIPYLLGEQSPAWRPKTRGGFLSMDFRHNRGHLTRAVLEGITYSIYRIIESIQSVHVTPINEIRLTGGLAASTLWQQIAADIFGVPLLVTESNEGSARGAAILAWHALGYLNNMQEIDISRLTKTHVQPRKEVHEFYRQQYPKYLACIESIHMA
jgi:gluconokinase